MILRVGGRGTRCLRLSIIRSTTQTLHHTLWHCTTAEFGTAQILLLEPTMTGTLCLRQTRGRSALIGRLESELKALQGSREAPEGQKFTAELDVTCGVSGTGNVARRPAELRHVSTRVSVSVRCAPRTWKHTWNNSVTQRQRKNQHSTECGTKKKKLNKKKKHSLVSKSHSPFFKRFVFYRGGIQTPLLKKKVSLSDCQLSWKLLRSVFSLLLLLQCVAGSEVRYSNQNSLRPNVARPSSQSNEPTTFCCISSVWTLAGNLRMLPSVENLNGHPYIVLFLLLVRMCVRVCVCYVKTKKSHQMWKKKTRATQV